MSKILALVAIALLVAWCALLVATSSGRAEAQARTNFANCGTKGEWTVVAQDTVGWNLTVINMGVIGVGDATPQTKPVYGCKPWGTP